MVPLLFLLLSGTTLSAQSRPAPGRAAPVHRLQISVQQDMIVYPRIRYLHTTGVEPDVRSRPTLGHEMSLSLHYVHRKVLSVGIGASFGWPRRIVYGISSGEGAVTGSGNADIRPWKRDRLSPNGAMTLSMAFHHHLDREERHQLEFGCRMLIRRYVAQRVVHATLLHDGQEVSVQDLLTISWHYDVAQPVWHLQPFAGYAWCFPNGQRLSVRVLMNLGWEQGTYSASLQVHPGTDRAGSGEILIRPGFIACSVVYGIILPRKARDRRKFGKVIPC